MGRDVWFNDDVRCGMVDVVFLATAVDAESER